jgi:methylenetetrahydrofolate reductase (NADPH)
MRIIDAVSAGKQFVSLEFFPPKERSEWPSFFKTAELLSRLKPLFASVTYGAGGSGHSDTLEIVKRLKQEQGLETMAHLTCIGSDQDELHRFLDRLAEADVHNVLALRGDLPKDDQPGVSICPTLRYASDLVSFISAAHPEFGIGVAGYPEVHPEATNADSDLSYLKLKLDQGGDFVITQLFFDNRIYFDFVDKCRSIGINKPIVPGILPVVSLKVIRRIMSLCGANIPPAYMAELEEADRSGGTAAVQKLGIAHARRQAKELLAGGAPGVHLYTLNRSDAVTEIAEGLLSA